VDMRTGLVMERASEMQRRHKVYVPPSLDGFRQGTENSRATLVDPRTGIPLEPQSEMRRGFAHADTHPADASCSGQIIDGRCYLFNPMILPFKDAEAFCKSFSPEGHVAAITSQELHSQLASLVTIASNGPTLTWLGGIQKDEHYQWTDGSPWVYADWMPGHPDLQRGSCMEMFRMEGTWWTSVDCSLKRASLCSFPLTF
uniref:C-type lectin domain-containing protein n=1 Tax=Denticeps clupeoides TaxID=299321 RepID=A0AAY4A8C3_9TELE